MTVDNDALAREIEVIKKCSAENYRTLRGKDGDVGLVAKVEAIGTSVESLKNSDLPQMEDRIVLAMKTQADKNITWPSLLKGLLAPVTIAVIISVAVTLVTKFFF
jgi:hypothetical protein